MMERKDKFISYEFACELNKRGINFKSEYYWGTIQHNQQKRVFHTSNNICKRNDDIPAYLVCELLNILPENIEVNHYILPFTYFKHHNMNCVGYYTLPIDPESESPDIIVDSIDSLPNTLAKLLIKLVDRDLISVVI